jgi:hypothetical protein
MFSKAPPSALATRKQVSIHVPENLTTALRAATKDLNTRFVTYLREQRQNTTNQMEETWEDAMKDYVVYARSLKTHYRRRGGVVLACGSNDCGQTGHGRNGEGEPNEPGKEKKKKKKKIF